METILTEIQIAPIKPQNGLVGFASVVFNGSLYLGSIGIYTRPMGGYRLTYPTRKTQDASLPIFYPINKLISSQIEAAIIEKYEEVVKPYDRHDSPCAEE